MTLNTEEYSSPPANANKGFFKRSYSIEVWKDRQHEQMRNWHNCRMDTKARPGVWWEMPSSRAWSDESRGKISWKKIQLWKRIRKTKQPEKMRFSFLNLSRMKQQTPRYYFSNRFSWWPFDDQVKLTILIKLTDAIVGLGQVVKTVEVEDGSLIHMETRDPRQDPDLVSMEVLLTVEVLDFWSNCSDNLLGGEGADCSLDEETASLWFHIWSSRGGWKKSQREGDLVPEAHIRPRPLQPHQLEAGARIGHDSSRMVGQGIQARLLELTVWTLTNLQSTKEGDCRYCVQLQARPTDSQSWVHSGGEHSVGSRIWQGDFNTQQHLWG